jgi:peptide-methionine (S)-S-oxide reductase
VIRTRVGYAGGGKEDPTYYNLGDHAETIQIDYDPARISYAELLDLFWASHSPTVRPFSTQYASIIFYQDEGQRRAAEASRDREAARRGVPIYTEIQSLTRFYLAEDYHQKYRLRQDRVLLAEFQDIYPDPADLVASTAAARVNGYLGGNGSLDQLQAELDDLGLSPAAEERLLERVSAWP